MTLTAICTISTLDVNVGSVSWAVVTLWTRDLFSTHRWAVVAWFTTVLNFGFLWALVTSIAWSVVS